jgi:hypothetical protein
MFGKMTLVLEKSSLIACFGLAVAVCGLILLKKAILAVSKSTTKNTLIFLISPWIIALGLIIILQNEKATQLLMDCLGYCVRWLN